MNIDQIVADFNTTLKDLALNIANVCPTSLIGSNIRLIQNAIDNPKNKTKFIDIFVQRVLIYKSQIDNGEEDFFLGKSYQDIIDRQTTNDDKKDILERIFEFKELWKTLNKMNKNIVIQYMQLLSMLAEQYFIIIDQNSQQTL